jgi:hypothetical protein
MLAHSRTRSVEAETRPAGGPDIVRRLYQHKEAELRVTCGVEGRGNLRQ